MSDTRKIWIAPLITGALATVVGGFILAEFFPQNPAMSQSKESLDLPSTFVIAEPATVEDRICYATAADCLAKKHDYRRARNGCEALPRWFQQFQAATFSVSRSSAIGGCIVSLKAETQNEWMIFDLQGALIDTPLLFHCDRSGVDNVVLEAARKLEGKVIERPYHLYVVNAQGGASRTLETPPTGLLSESLPDTF